MSGHSVSAAHEKIMMSSARRGPASSNGHRQRAPEIMTENESDSMGSPRLLGRMSPPDPANDARPPRRRQRRVFPPGCWVQRIHGVRT